MKIEFTRQAFIEYAMPILDKAYAGDQDAQGIIRAMLLEAYELDPQITNLKAQLYDAVTVIKNILERGHTNAWVHKALQQPEVMQPILSLLNAMNGTVIGGFECAQAKANPDHRCINQCWVCRFPAQRDAQPAENGKG